jgi:hypothetical protein
LVAALGERGLLNLDRAVVDSCSVRALRGGEHTRLVAALGERVWQKAHARLVAALGERGLLNLDRAVVEFVGFLREAEELIEGKAAGKKE